MQALLVTYLDGSKATVRFSLGDQVQAERQGVSIQDRPLEFMSRAAFSALKRSGETFTSFDDWVGSVETVGLEEETDKVDPTETEAGSD